MTQPKRVPAMEALERLREGNGRFASNVRSIDSLLSQARRTELAAEQQPFAIILGCSDSRAPAEIVFDQGLGDLFVIRVAGNVVAPSQIGSVEFAADRFGIRLVVVMGHTRCGAIDATLQAVLSPNSRRSKNISSIVDRIIPVVEPLAQTELADDLPALLRAAGRANVRAAANQLRHGSRPIEELMLQDGLVVVGAEYDIVSGVVEFFDGVPIS